jgi:four helix bundle protein
MAHKVEELPIYQEAQTFCAEVTAVLGRSSIPRNSKRYKQIVDANESILPNIDEGFDQESDDAFAKYLYYSKGSMAEVMRRLRRAAAVGEVSALDVSQLHEKSDRLGKMFGGFIKYLKRSGFRDRGRFRV